jgi:hypothetical protein
MVDTVRLYTFILVIVLPFVMWGFERPGADGFIADAALLKNIGRGSQTVKTLANRMHHGYVSF